jgi:hypothetical protein
MRFNYTNRAQSDGRVKCEKCNLPMLGIDEQDPRQWHVSTLLAKTFCDCPAMTENKPKEDMVTAYINLAAKHSREASTLKTQLKEAMDALEFYANNDLYTLRDDRQGGEVNDAFFDDGQTARTTLAKIKRSAE